ncbi:unnamed protein product [Rhizophagus irregularis]|uniref:Uncharacterized protein n=1 Tax=Rhizophagus irregularis (strain DAOM 197198w) TaxID=1432141 RepID=A0A015LI03_RHIIW|nr:hypothetical protein RirG_006770 [Rhizophagus irregularis DAOM 197198w]CAB4494398.1 unnamed protein product [Rhizophagus irregularis]
MKLMNFFTEDIINHEKSKKMELKLNSNEYYNDKDKKPKIECLHIFIVLTSTGSTGSTGLSLKSTADAISEAERLF